MTYEDLYEKLRDYFREMKVSVWMIREKEIVGIEVDSPGIDGLERTKKVMEIAGNDYRCVLLPNDGVISIKKMNHE